MVGKQAQRLAFETLAATLKKKKKGRHGMILLYETSRLANRKRENRPEVAVAQAANGYG